jgi:hypothetical protein
MVITKFTKKSTTKKTQPTNSLINRLNSSTMSITRIITKALVILLGTATTHGHGYLKSPRSRNYVAHQEGVFYGGTENDPIAETCPHCLNIGGTEAQCGISGDHNYDYPPNAVGGVLPPNTQAVYNRGDVIDVEVLLTAHHKGHFLFYACPINEGEGASDDCFKSHPLEFVSDNLYGAPKDEAFPYRAYIAPADYPGTITDNEGLGGKLYSYKMKLPNDISGDLVLIQWWWLTANSCDYEGYDKYSWPADWNMETGSVPQCGVIPSDGRGTPEQFWNCAEVTILDDGKAPPTTHSPAPATPAPTQIMATPEPTPAPSPGEPNIGNYCGSSWADAFKCGIPCVDGNSTVCNYGENCYAEVTCSVAPSPTSTPTKEPVSSPTTEQPRTCGGGNIGNGLCPDPSLCCSSWGYCGTGEAWCSNGRNLRGGYTAD